MQRAMTDSEISRLGESDVFETLSDDDLRAVARVASVLEFGPQCVVLSPQSHAPAAYIVLDGRVKLFEMPESGREVIVEIAGAGDVFGCFSDDEECEPLVWAETIDAATVAAIPARDFPELLRRYPSVALGVVASMGGRLSRRESKIEDLALRDVAGRIAHTLLMLGEEHGVMTSHGITINLRLRHQDIANMVAATRETVSMILGRMRRRGSIEIEHRRVRITHPEHLLERALLERPWGQPGLEAARPAGGHKAGRSRGE